MHAWIWAGSPLHDFKKESFWNLHILKEIHQVSFLLYYLWEKGDHSRDIIRWKEGGVANQAIMVKLNVNFWTVRRVAQSYFEKTLKNG